MKKSDVLSIVISFIFATLIVVMILIEGPNRIETRIMYLMVDQNGHIIKELTIDELRKETSGEMKHDNN